MPEITELRLPLAPYQPNEVSPFYEYTKRGTKYYTPCKDEYDRAQGFISTPHTEIFRDGGLSPIYMSNRHAEDLINPHAVFLGLHLIKSQPLHIGKLSLQDNIVGFWDGGKGTKFINVEYDIVSTAFGHRIFAMSSSGVVMEVPIVDVPVETSRPKGVFIRITHNDLGVAGRAASKYASLSPHEQSTHNVLEAIAAQFVAYNTETRYANVIGGPSVPRFANSVDTKSATVVTYIPLTQLVKNRSLLDTTSNLLLTLGEPRAEDKHPACIGVQPEVLNKSEPTHFISGIQFISPDKNASVWVKTPAIDIELENSHSATELKATADIVKPEGIYFTHTIQPSGIVVEKYLTLDQACAKEFIYRTRDEALNPNAYREAKLLRVKHDLEQIKHAHDLDKLERGRQNDTIKSRVEETTLLGKFFNALGQILSWLFRWLF